MMSSRKWMLAATVLVVPFLLVGMYAREWNPSLSHDTLMYFYPRVEMLNTSPLLHVMNDAFLVPPGTASPDAAEAKPVFVAIVALWHHLYRIMGLSKGSLPDNVAYCDFVTASLIAAFLAIAWLGRTMDRPAEGVVAGSVALANPWSLTAIYFNSYTAISMVFLCLAFGLMHEGGKARLFLAGILAGAVVLVNQSAIVIVAACGVVPLLKPGGLGRAVNRFLWLIAGAGAFWCAVEVLILSNSISTGRAFMPEVSVLAAYLRRSISERNEFPEVTRSFMFPYILWNFSWPYAVALAAAFALYGNRLRSRGIAAAGTGEGVAGIVALLAFLLIDLRDGPRFSRTYVLLLPFASLFLVATLHDAVAGIGRWRRVAASCLAALAVTHAAYTAKGLHDQKRAFLDVRDLLVSHEPGRRIFLLRADSYLPFFYQLAGGDGTAGRTFGAMVIDDLCDLSLTGIASPATVIVGPNVPSILNLPGYHTATVDLPLHAGGGRSEGLCGDVTWSARMTGRVPFFSHYPYLALEDQRETFRLRYQRTFGWHDCMDGIGSVSVWDVVYGTRR